MATESTQNLIKALEAGSYNAAPGTLVQGAALQLEDLSSTMQVVTFEDKHIKLQKMLKIESCKSTLAQFDRQMSYGIFGSSAQVEGALGQEENSEFARVVVAMAYYSHVRRVTLVANIVDTVDGVKAEDRASQDAAIKLSADIEFDSFRGKADFSNGGVFDGSMSAIPALPNMLGIDCQIRQSDYIRNARDLMFDAYGANLSVVQQVGGLLTQDAVEDSHVRSVMQHGSAEKLLVDPLVLSAYNKISYGKERIILAGSPQDATGADLRRQWVSGGAVTVEASRFLSGKTGSLAPRSNGPSAPVITLANTAAGTSLAAGVYTYYATGENELGESPRSAAVASASITAGDSITVTFATPSTGARFHNVYRSAAGGSAASARFIGRVAVGSTFVDLGNKIPGFVTGFLLDEGQGTPKYKQLSPFSEVKLAITDLTTPKAFLDFRCVIMEQPRKSVLLDNLRGSL